MTGDRRGEPLVVAAAVQDTVSAHTDPSQEHSMTTTPHPPHRRRRGVVTVIIATLVALGAVGSAAIAVVGDFEDVSGSNVFRDDIRWLAQKGITRGCNPPANDRFCPTDSVTRQQMATFMRKLHSTVVRDGVSHAGWAEDAEALGGIDAIDYRRSRGGTYGSRWDGTALPGTGAGAPVSLESPGPGWIELQYNASFTANSQFHLATWMEPMDGASSCDDPSAQPATSSYVEATSRAIIGGDHAVSMSGAAMVESTGFGDRRFILCVATFSGSPDNESFSATAEWLPDSSLTSSGSLGTGG